MANAHDGPASRLSDTIPRIEIGLKLSEPINGALLKAFLAEFVGMTFFIFVTVGTIVNGCKSADVGIPYTDPLSLGFTVSGYIATPDACLLSTARILTIAAAFGFSIFVFVFATAAFSGGHLNPAITLGFLLAKRVTLLRTAGYWVAQVTGAILGAAFARAININAFRAAHGGTNVIAPGTREAGAWLMEAALTCALVYIVFAATDHIRAQSTTHLSILAPLAIGMVVFVCHLVAIPIDGCSINPARSFGPAVVARRWANMWVFWVGPFTGAIAAALIYELGFRPTFQQIPQMQETGPSILAITAEELPGPEIALRQPHGFTVTKELHGGATAEHMV